MTEHKGANGRVPPNFSVEGCPAADGKAACWPYCGGGWPGTTVTTEAMTKGITEGRLVPERLGCQPLTDRAKAALALLREMITQTEEVK